MKSLKKTIPIFLGLAFLLFAYWQINDPDPHLWIPVYIIPAVLSFSLALASSLSRSLKLLFWLLAVGYLLGAIIYYPSHYEGLGLENLSMKTEQVEFARESFGLGICGIVMVIYAVFFSKN
jgi:hypothetical protein